MSKGGSAGQPTDHEISHRHVLSSASYPNDVKPLRVRWFYAVDIPKWKPFVTSKPQKQPTKFIPFSSRDNRAIESAFQKSDDGTPDRVLVNEDHLFQVDVLDRTLSPVYWQGPIYEIRRGTWFALEGSSLKPLDENIATQVEEGFLKIKPFRRTTSTAPESSEDATKRLGNHETWPLYGPHLGKFVIYTDPYTAWILSDDLYGKLSSTLFQKLTSGSNLGGTKIFRGYTESAKARTIANLGDKELVEDKAKTSPKQTSEKDEEHEHPDSAENQENKVLESEMKEDYSAKDDPDRQIDHLILCVHGIGQKLGERLESVNFVHDVNVLRKTLKMVYELSHDLRALNGDTVQAPPNSGVQVLPVVWRHHIKFGLSKETEHTRHQNAGEERDIGEMDDETSASELDEEYPTLSDITIEAIPSIRSIVSDVLLDILLYYQPRSREQIIRTVSQEMNRIYKLFRQQNPNFNGRVSLVGHSLGSTILFDILCRQPTEPGRPKIPSERHVAPNLALEFDVDNFFAFGSPIGLFQMLKGKNIRARSQNLGALPLSPVNTDLDDPFSNTPEVAVSCPKLGDFYNIFHPTDPISYRVEPLVSKAMARLRPQPLPWTKKGLGMQLGYISGFGQRMATSASSLWSGFTSNLLNRSLGFHGIGPSEQKGPRDGPQLASGGEIETLYSGFQRSQADVKTPEETKIRSEEVKVRALNRNGRIDYAIQEGVFDVSLISSIASHLGYWSEEDVAHFLLGQLLSRSKEGRKE